ncbi:hypothetical protein AB0L40_21300 [Patulibacter sp. NPDC049589]|uniref:hypothetical protein n=1 Tax=Patulibacter sp. NPDC049589 TaxID=3154731 RepID=UPI0034406C47
MSDTGPRTPNADAAREAAAAAGEGQAAGGVRRLTDADAKGRRGKRTSDEDAAALPPSRPLIQNAGIVVGAFAGATVVAEVAGATNLGTALSFGQIGFAIALVFVLVRR